MLGEELLGLYGICFSDDEYIDDDDEEEDN